VWQQNHCGVFYSSDGAASWRRVSDQGQGAHFGFPIAADAQDGRVAWIVPGRSDQQRMAIEGGLFVARTQDQGRSWQQLREGLPQENAYDVVYRHALDNSGDRLAFGSTNLLFLSLSRPYLHSRRRAPAFSRAPSHARTTRRPAVRRFRS
jgi:hypothetical protein